MLNFTVYGAPVIISLSPSSGPLLGGTIVRVRGGMLSRGSHYLCRFADAVVDGTEVGPHETLCSAPPAADAALIALEISLNGQNFTSSEVLFAYYGLSMPALLCPSSGPVEGGTLVRIVGTNLSMGSHYQASLHGTTNTSIVPASYMDIPSASLRIVTPVLPVGLARVDIALNGQQFQPFGALGMHAYPAPHINAISPACGPVHGETRVSIGGTNFSGGSHLLCRFHDVLQNASLASPTELRCVAPPIDSTEQLPSVLEVSLNGQQFTAGLNSWKYTAVPRISSIRPVSIRNAKPHAHLLPRVLAHNPLMSCPMNQTLIQNSLLLIRVPRKADCWLHVWRRLADSHWIKLLRWV